MSTLYAFVKDSWDWENLVDRYDDTSLEHRRSYLSYHCELRSSKLWLRQSRPLIFMNSALKSDDNSGHLSATVRQPRYTAATTLGQRLMSYSIVPKAARCDTMAFLVTSFVISWLLCWRDVLWISACHEHSIATFALLYVVDVSFSKQTKQPTCMIDEQSTAPWHCATVPVIRRTYY